MSNAPAYGLWSLVILDSVVFIFFAFSFAKPRSARDWRSFGGFSAFIVALFAEMYGFPLTIYLLSGWLQTRYPGTDFLSHDAGHLLETLFGWRVNPHFGPFHIASNIFIALGFILLYRSWQVLYRVSAQGPARDPRTLSPHAPSAVRRFRGDHARVPPAVAYDPHARHVPRTRLHVCATRAKRRARGRAGIRGRLAPVCGLYARAHPSLRPAGQEADA